MKTITAVALLILSLPAMASDKLTGNEIMAKAHLAAGGDTWANPKSAFMSGYGLFWYNGSDTPVRHEPHRMWRVYPAEKGAAHQADGKVRIDSFRGEHPVFQVSFDGTNTYNQQGKVDDELADSNRWASNFGFGVIRHAFDDGYNIKRVADDQVDGHEVYVVQITDPAGGKTLFAFDKDDFMVRKLGFMTPRGWHERLYSDHFSKPGISWIQPGKVRLFYNGVKSNEVYWTDFEINNEFSDEVFVLPAVKQ